MPVRVKLSPMFQVRRSANAITNGQQILDEVRAHEDAIVEVAERGLPPVSAVSAVLKAKYPKEMDAAPVRQFVGTAVKAVLHKRGFEVLQTGVRLPRDPVFRTGAVYRKAVIDADKGKEAVRALFSNMVSAMTRTEQRILLDVVRTALGEA
jgi:hypothetical protein